MCLIPYDDTVPWSKPKVDEPSPIEGGVMNVERLAKIARMWMALLLIQTTLPVVALEASSASLHPQDVAADMGKPVQVFILMGQSNMLGFGKIGAADQPGTLTHAVQKKGKYPYLVDEAGDWTVRQDVRNVRVMSSGTGSMQRFNNEWMTITGGNIGPEIGIGHHLGQALSAPVLILKSCIGNRSLGWDLLPPGSERFEEGGFIYAGYGDTADKWKKGDKPKKGGWKAGVQYDGDVANAKTVLKELRKHYPGAKRYEVAGLFFWQGDKDRYNEVHASRYEINLVRLVEQLRKDFDAPQAKFVCATLGQTAKGAGGAEGQILEAQLAVDGNAGKYRKFKGNVATVYSKPHCHGGASSGHYGGNAETYMDIGEAMGLAMVELLGTKSATFETVRPYLDALTKPAHKALKSKSYVRAHQYLQAIEQALEDGGAEELDAEAAENRQLAYGVLKSELMSVLRPAIAEVTALRQCEDLYALSLVLPDYQKRFAGIEAYDSAAGDLPTQLKTTEARAEIAAGKNFYRYIEKLAKSEAKAKKPRDERALRSIQKALTRIAEQHPDSVYGEAATLAADELANLQTPVAEPKEYVRLAAG